MAPDRRGHRDSGAPKHGAASVVEYFVSTFVPEPASQRLATLARDLGPEVEPMPASRMHITYRSFEGLPPGRLVAVKEAVRQVGARQAPFRALVKGGGSFEGGVVWVGVESDAVWELRRQVDRAFRRLDVPPAKHPFVPHITLGRGPAGVQAPAFLDEISLAFPVEEILLTTTGRAEYRVVLRVPLGEDPSGDPPRSPHRGSAG